MKYRTPPPKHLDRRQVLSTPLAIGLSAAIPTGLSACTSQPRPDLSVTRSAPATRFKMALEGGTIRSLACADDQLKTDYIIPGQGLGQVRVRFATADGQMQTFDTETCPGALMTNEALPDGGSVATYTLPGQLAVECRLTLEGDALTWTIRLSNLSDKVIDVNDLELPLPIQNCLPPTGEDNITVLKHSFISGHGSFLYWMRSNCVGPYLALVPQRDTSLEYWRPSVREDDEMKSLYSVFIHSAAAGEIARQEGCNWRQAHTHLKLSPAGSKNASADYGLRFLWVEDQADIRGLLFQNGQLDIHVVPGMTVPTDLDARIAIRSQDAINRLVPEFPETTTCQALGRRGDYDIYEVRFARLGENRLTVHHGDTRHTHLEFFVTEPIETLIRKRAAFIAGHQIRDTSKWYDGLLAEWNMDSKVRLSPDNYDRIKGWRIYEVTCDDPGLSKPAFLASKNADIPDQSEVDAVDYYIDRFVWGGLQRTAEETYTYGIYGIPDWKTNRTGDGIGDRPRTEGPMHIWRPYDYPHIFLMYYSMYRVARHQAHIKTRHPTRVYLERAAGTAIGMFTIPLAVIDWSAYETGFYNELVIPQIIDALMEEGMDESAATLRDHWRRKIRVFTKLKPDLFVSEYSFDSTGFESTYALAHDALKNPTDMGVTQDEAHAFLETQLKANLFCRGTIEPAYFILGSDCRPGGTDRYALSYMAQMGGWAVQEYALNEAPDPHEYLRLGYASYLSSWALVNSGTPESSYGYWYPGPENDGGAGGGFEAASFGETWLDQPHHRGSWYYSCEIDLGFCGALRAARTILADDPIFGRVCYGGVWQAEDSGVSVWLRDGVRKRFSLRLETARLDIAFDSARFATHPVYASDNLDRLQMTVDSSNPEAHTTAFQIRGLPAGRYQICCDDTCESFMVLRGSDSKHLQVRLGALADSPRAITINRIV